MRSDPTKCEMILAHHADCECPWCRANLDERCSAPAVAALLDRGRLALRVCDGCAVEMHLADDAYMVQRDDGRPVMSS